MFKASDDELIEKFNNLKNRADVAELLEVDEKSLRYILYVKRPENMYKKFNISKKKGGFRTINAPEESLKAIQKKLSYIFSLIYNKKACAYGFIKGRDIRGNSKQHIKRNFILNIDLENFFDSINFGRVICMFEKPPYNVEKDAATVLSQLVCCNGILPQGAPSSPIITNMICRPLDTQLVRLAKKFSLNYTRYADDITFSCNKSKFPEEIAYYDKQEKLCIGKSLQEVISRNGFKVNTNKVFLNYKDRRQEVTGLIVNRFPNLRREYLKEIRAILYNCRRYDIYLQAKKYIEESSYTNKNIMRISMLEDKKSKEIICKWFKNVISGKIRFIGNIRGKESPCYIKYALECNKLFDEEIFKIIKSKSQELIENTVFVVKIEKGSKYIQGSGFFIQDLGFVTSMHVTPDIDETYDVFTPKEDIPRKLCLFNNKANNQELDYSIYDLKNPTSNYLKLGDSSNLNIGDRITVCGYPMYDKGDSIYIQNGEITNLKKGYFGSRIYTVSQRLIHGISGGAVLNTNNEVIGIIKAGAENMDEEDESIQGFIPINDVIEDIKSQGIELRPKSIVVKK